MSTAPLLFELGTEELPPGNLRALGEALRAEMCARLTEQRIAHGEAHWFAAPRRLAVLVEDLPAMQADTVIEKLGPQISAAFDAAGNPTGAARGFARGCGVEVEALVRTPGEKGERLAFRQRVAGQPVAALLPALIEGALGALPIARRMRWGARRAEFVRPAHWVVLLHGSTVVPGTVLGVTTGRETRGHRVHGKARIELAGAADYPSRLRSEGYVIADYEERRALVARQVDECARAAGGFAEGDAALLEEVCSLVEWPHALAGRFEERFLAVPPEALVSSMKGHQKFFPVRDAAGALLPCFITVANLDSRDAAQVVAGNERVIRPRLADAEFFYAQDRQTTLAARRERLRTIVYQTELGTLWDKSERVAALAATIGAALGADAGLSRRAGELSKSDLVAEMVLEFDELQGTMGRYYALHDGEPEELADALAEQYLPRQAGGALPQSPIGCALALADRIDTLVGIFGIGQPPTGSRDPFGLRRAALGALRILVERELALDLQPLLEQAAAQYPLLPHRDSVVATVRDYMFERFRAWYADAGVRVECVLAVQARGITAPLDFAHRVRAVAAFSAMPEAAALAAANKRVSNLLLKQGGGVQGVGVREALLQDEAERQLALALGRSADAAAPLLARSDYTGALRVLAELRAPVDTFFDKVLVMADDAALRANRLALLAQLHAAFMEVADISVLAATP
jgi:glycyl-tRNA synthetase beta chain